MGSTNQTEQLYLIFFDLKKNVIFIILHVCTKTVQLIKGGNEKIN